MDLPEDFAKIPLSSPASGILSSVPGTEEAKDAVLIAQIPTVMEIDPKSAAAQAKVSYSGDPQFRANRRNLALLRNKHSRQSDQGWRCLLFVPARRVVYVAERPRTLDDGQFHSEVDLHDPSKFAGLQRNLRNPDDHLQRNRSVQLYESGYHGCICRGSYRGCHRLQRNWLLLSALYVLPALWISDLSSISGAVRVRLFL